MRLRRLRHRAQFDEQRKLDQRVARKRILAVANRYRIWNNPNAKPWGARHINQAVCVVRRRQLVKSNVLEAAGFNAHG